ncbi:phospholipase A1-like [Sitodiplosis mosellana]|uniref:phospholipase A1-like n=1 Tax=Sitodiplosis mosellana TaxID=263140 RepID=UPI00244442E7|nr:phospholipase A1-like [Sitodiplosis mosellana]
MSKISAWMAKVIETCSTIAPSTSISNTWLIGHSLGSHMIGYTAKSLNKLTSKVEKLIGLDPAGPLFIKKFGGGKCQGIQKEYAIDTMVFLTNPGGLGTENDKLAAVNVHVNLEKDYCQYRCQCNSSMCNHIYASTTLFGALARREDLKGTYLADKEREPIHTVTIYKTMKPGVYAIESSKNPSLQQAKTHAYDEL